MQDPHSNLTDGRYKPEIRFFIGLLSVFDRGATILLNRPTSLFLPIFLAVALILVPLLLLYLSPGILFETGIGDSFIPLNTADRYLRGDTPHRDFFTPLGFVYYVLHGVAAQLTGLNGRILMVANFLALPALLALTVASIRGRLPFWSELSILVFVGIITISPNGTENNLLNHLANYNRHGWILAMAAVLCVFLGGTEGERPYRRYVDITVITSCLILSFYLKISFAIIIGAGIFLAFILKPERRTLAAICAVLAIGAVLLMTALFDPQLHYLQDILRALKSTSVRLDNPLGRGPGLAKFRADMGQNGFFIMSFIGLCVAFIAKSRPDPAALRLVLAATVTLVLVVAANNQNFSLNNEGLLIPFALLTAATTVTGATPPNRTALRAGGMLVFVTLIYVLGYAAATNTSAIRHYLTLSSGLAVRPVPAAHTILDDTYILPKVRLSDELFYLPTQWLDQGLISGSIYKVHVFKHRSLADYAYGLADGYDALQRFAPGLYPVFNSDFSNPFPVLTMTRPPNGDSMWWHYGRTFSEPTIGAVKPTLADTNVVMQVKHDRWGNGRHLWRLIEEDVMTDFQIAGQTNLWVVWVRRSALQPPK